VSQYGTPSGNRQTGRFTHMQNLWNRPQYGVTEGMSLTCSKEGLPKKAWPSPKRPASCTGRPTARMASLETVRRKWVEPGLGRSESRQSRRHVERPMYTGREPFCTGCWTRAVQWQHREMRLSDMHSHINRCSGCPLMQTVHGWIALLAFLAMQCTQCQSPPQTQFRSVSKKVRQALPYVPNASDCYS
jgi:hypothetical protein